MQFSSRETFRSANRRFILEEKSSKNPWKVCIPAQKQEFPANQGTPTPLINCILGPHSVHKIEICSHSLSYSCHVTTAVLLSPWTVFSYAVRLSLSKMSFHSLNSFRWHHNDVTSRFCSYDNTPRTQPT